MINYDNGINENITMCDYKESFNNSNNNNNNNGLFTAYPFKKKWLFTYEKLKFCTCIKLQN